MAYPKEMTGIGGSRTIPRFVGGKPNSEFIDAVTGYFKLDKTDQAILSNPGLQPMTAADLMIKANRSSKFKSIDSTMNSFVRDLPGKNRSKHPIETDPFTTDRSGALITRFGPIAEEWLKTIGNIWTEMGWPTEVKTIGSKDYKVPDTVAMIDKDPAFLDSILKDKMLYGLMCETVADADALKRFSVQRYVRPFWYVRSYEAKRMPVLTDHQEVLSWIGTSIKLFASSPKGVAMIEDQLESSSDPFGTNTGWPLFSADYKGRDAKFLMQALMSVLKDKKQTMPELANLKYQDVIAYASRVRDLANTVTNLTADLPLFTVQPSRRFKPNSKPTPNFDDTVNATLESMIAGVPDQRLVYMFSYVHNLISAYPAAVIRAWKKSIEGMSHDEDGKKMYAKPLRSNYLCLLENDAGGFDSDISNNHVVELAHQIGESLSHMFNPTLIKELINEVVRAPLVLPTPFSTQMEPSGHVMIGDRGLESGSKWTGEVGSIMTKWMNLVVYKRLGWISKDQAIAHLTGKPLPKGRLQLISGDDNTHIIFEATEIKPLAEALATVYAEFGPRADLEFSDRFLMRHVRGMIDTPVAGRIFQQRASNEHVPSDQFTASMGWLASCENLFGYRYTQAAAARVRSGADNSTATRSKWTHPGYVKIQAKYLERLMTLNDTALIRLPYMTGLRKAIANPFLSVSADAEMNSCSIAMTNIQMKAKGQGYTALRAMVEALLKDSNSPSVKHQLDILVATNKQAKAILDELSVKGSAFQRDMLTIMGLIKTK